MGLKDNYVIKSISNSVALDIVIKNHYLHRVAPVTYSFGIFEKLGSTDTLFPMDRLVGVILYGSPASRGLSEGICGKEYFKEVLELTRLWIEDDTPKNIESYFIGNTIKLLKEKIIVSYSEPSQNHLGIVYQASNFIYTGLSEKRTDRLPVDKNIKLHSRTLTNSSYKDIETVLVERPRKHRYVYFNCKPKERKKFISLLKYTIKPYPKNVTNCNKTT